MDEEVSKFNTLYLSLRERKGDHRATKQQLTGASVIRQRHQMCIEQMKMQNKEFATMKNSLTGWNNSCGITRSSKRRISTLKRVSIIDLNVEMFAEDCYLLLRIIEPGYIMTGWHTVAEDHRGNVCVFSSYNYFSREHFSVGTVFILKEPYLSVDLDGLYALICGCPTDIIVLGSSHPLYHLAKDVEWQNQLHESAENLVRKCQLSVHPEEWKERGNALFKSGKLVLAQEVYQLGLQLCTDQNLIWKFLNLHLTAVYFELGYFEKTIATAATVLQTFPGETEALMRSGKAYYNLKKYEDALKVLEECHQQDLDDPEGQYELERVRLRVNEQKYGCISYTNLKAECRTDPLKKLDCADYVGPVKIVRSPGKGRGVVVTEDVIRGTLLVVSKAFVSRLAPVQQIGGSFEGRSKFDCPGSADVAKEVAEAVAKNPKTFGPIIYNLSAGVEPRKDVQVFCDPETNQEPICDVELIKAICNSNTFAIGKANSIASKTFGGRGCGLFIFPSYINHCCITNCYTVYYNDVMFIYAQKSLKAGEEIFLSYIPPTNYYDQRMKMCAQRGFSCNCRLCQLKI